MAALVLAIIPCTALIGLVMGIVALVRISGAPSLLKGKGLAIAAIAVPWVTFFIGGMMAAIAIPNFLKFQTRAKQTEARTLLKTIYMDETSYQEEHGKPPTSFAEMGMTFEPRRRYAYFFGSQTDQPDIGGPYAIPQNLAAQIARPSVLAAAVGKVDSGNDLDVWVIGTDGTLTQLGGDTPP